ncbi:NAD-dependent epimerase/dehydratase family protein [Roseovarius sp. C7]|uniref:NAD-dependent epimerase/dehydratase family protein n=1 Tax=Roseovarius sp. C7 TaxID=3398643 RepID=UPI0039F640CD
MQGKMLLTGGTGMVGRNILAHPAASDWEVLAPSSRELDLMDAARVRAYIEEHKPDLVIHAAGRVGGIQANMANPVAFLETNTAMGRNIVMGAWSGGVRKLVNLASTCMYPRAAENPLREEMILSGPLEPTNEGYALAKIMTMRLCEYIRREDPQAQYKTLIPCNLYGLHDTFDPKASHLLPAVIHKLHVARETGLEEVESGAMARPGGSSCSRAIWRMPCCGRHGTSRRCLIR